MSTAPAAAQKYGIGKSALINAFWVPLHFQDTALITIAVPAAMVALAPRSHVRVFALAAALVSLVSMIVPPIAGAFSDRLRRTGVPRRAFIVAGAALDVSCLVMMARVHRVDAFVALLLLATVGANVSLAAYQALIPDIVPPASWGMVSGVRSVAMVLGTVVGIAVAAGTLPSSTFIGIGICIGLGALTLFGVGEHHQSGEGEERVHVSDWHDFSIVFVARAFLAFGLALLMTFVLYFFRDILHVANPSAGTGLVAGASLIGAIASGIYSGWLSDRVPRKFVVAACGVPMAAAAAGFGLVPQQNWMYVFALLFGIGFGGIMSTGWALAIDSVPKLRDVARDLGLWGIAQNAPAVIAPLLGGWILAMYGGTLSGYRVLFFAAAGSFALGSFVVLGVGLRPVVAWWAVPFRIASALSVALYVRIAFRIRCFGDLPPTAGTTLLLSNHQNETDLMGIVSTLTLQRGRPPLLAATAKLMHEPGFMAVRIHWLWRLFHNANFGWFFEALGMMPLENELQARSVARWSWNIERRHGVLPLRQIFKASVLERFGFEALDTRDVFRAQYFHQAQQAYVKLSELHMPHRKEQFDLMRIGVEEDVSRIEDVMRRGATFYVTPEGEYSKDGSMLPLRGIWERLEPYAQKVYLVAIGYDPFAPGKFSQIYRIVPLRDRSNVANEMRMARPVTTSAVLASWLVGRSMPFSAAEAFAAVHGQLEALPPELFVDPELTADPQRAVERMLDAMAAQGLLERRGAQFTAGRKRTHPKFPLVGDIIAYQARFFAETLEGTSAQATGIDLSPLASA